MEVDLLLERDGVLCPVEVKKTASPSKKDARNLHALDPVVADDIPAGLLAFKRKIGCGRILCMVRDTFPVWAVWHETF